MAIKLFGMFSGLFIAVKENIRYDFPEENNR